MLQNMMVALLFTILALISALIAYLLRLMSSEVLTSASSAPEYVLGVTTLLLALLLALLAVVSVLLAWDAAMASVRGNR